MSVDMNVNNTATYEYKTFQQPPTYEYKTTFQQPPPEQIMDDSEPLTNDLQRNLFCPGVLACCLAPCLLCCPCAFCQTVSVKQERVYLSFGQYVGTLRKPGLYCVNPVCMTVKAISTKKVSTDLANVKVADGNGNPLLLSGVVTYVVKNSKKAALEVENYSSFLLTQGTAVMKQVASMYPYESRNGESSLKSEAAQLRQALVSNLQTRVDVAGIRVLNFEFNDLAYSPEIAQVMLVRQQAEAMIDARKVIAEGAVGIVHNTIQGLAKQSINLSDKEKVQLASNLVVSICSEGGVQRTLAVGASDP